MQINMARPVFVDCEYTQRSPWFTLSGLVATSAPCTILSTVLISERPDLLPRSADSLNSSPAAAVFTMTDEITPATSDTPLAAPLAPPFHVNDTMHRDLPVVSVATARPTEPRLPSGAVIDAKNTLQSFAVSDQRPPPAEANLVPNPPATDARDEDTPSTVVAVAVAADPSVLYAEVEPISSSPPNPQNQEISWYKRRLTLFLVLFCLALLAAAGMGAYIGTSSSGNKDSASGSSVAADVRNPTAPVNAPVVTNAPAIEKVGPVSAPMAAVVTSAPAVETSSPVKDPTVNPVIATEPPSRSPADARESVLTSYINDITNSSLFISPDGTIPASRALAWMIANDTTVLDTATLTSLDSDALSRSATGFRIRQRYPLLVMWFQQDIYGPWAVTGNWLQDLDECNWYGISCDSQLDSVSGENQNAVTRIFFNGTSSYVGVIPLDIGLLSDLQHFEITDTWISGVDGDRFLQGTLPDSIGQWTALTYFDVSYNFGLAGTLPDSIGRWTALTYFDAALNVLTGTLPGSIGQWTALTYFGVSGGSFGGSGGLNGTLPDSIGQWTALTYFDAGFNVLTGTLPDIIGQWTALTNFVAVFNVLTGTLPDSIGQWTNLTNFDVSSNALTGIIPSSIGNWSLIESADFSVNSYVGTLPNAICQYIDPDTDFLQVNCGVNCNCCTTNCV